MSIAPNFYSKVVGLTFTDGYPENILELSEIAGRQFLVSGGGVPEPLSVVLVRNPENQYDSNAIEVHVPCLGDYGMIGHLPAPLASRLAPLMDSGEEWMARINKVNVHPDHPTNPGVEVQVARADAGFEESDPEFDPDPF